MKFNQAILLSSLVLIALLLAGCTGTQPNNGTSGNQGGGQLLGSSLSESDYSIADPPATDATSDDSDVGSLSDTGFALTEQDLQ